jgi:hypothetical protein
MFSVAFIPSHDGETLVAGALDLAVLRLDAFFDDFNGHVVSLAPAR